MARTIEPAALNFAELIRPGETICWGQAASEPLTLTETLMAQRHTLGGITAFIGISWNKTVDPEHADAIAFSSYCGAGQNRRLHKAGSLDILPIHYSQFDTHLAGRVDVLFLQVAPGRTPGTYSFGLACEYLQPLIKSCRLVVAQVNAKMPSTPGLSEIAEVDMDIIVPSARDIPSPPETAPSETHRALANIIAGLVPDGATLQVGLGGIPAAIMESLSSHKHLGVHTGLYVDGLTDLIEAGVIDNSRKGVDDGYSVAGLIAGTEKTWKMCAETDLIRLAPTTHTHSLDILARLNAFTSINSAIEVDLTGQINAEVAGRTYVGAVGGGPDFARGAFLSKGGLPICALPASREIRGGGRISSIVPRLSAPVSISRADAGIIVTEFGYADLRGKSLKQRCEVLLDICHPDLRDDLQRDAQDGFNH